MALSSADVNQWYQDQVVFLTGGTGTLGGCLLFKLSVRLSTRRIYVLCRESVHQAIKKLEDSMPEQIDDILDSQRVRFVVGDVTKPNLGLGDADFLELQSQVTVVLNCAGNVSLVQDLRSSVADNCLPHLALMKLCEQFRRLKAFLYVSSAFVNNFLPGVTVEERVYDAYDDAAASDPHQDLQCILSTGSSRCSSAFVTPYTQAKYLTERLLLETSTPSSPPLLIIRPSNIGPAIRDPVPLYGLDMVIPVHTYIQFFLGSGGNHEAVDDILPPQTILEDVPVDLVANTCLLHLALGTTGIVHSAADLYAPRKISDLKRKCIESVPPDLFKELQRPEVAENPEAAKHLMGKLTAGFPLDWKFDCSRSDSLRNVQGPIGLALGDHDVDRFLDLRISRVARRFQNIVRKSTAATN